MSRTTRKPLFVIEENEEMYIKRQLCNRFRRYKNGDNYSTRSVRCKKPKEQYKAECEAADSEYNKLLKNASYDEFNRPYVGMTYRRDWSCGTIIAGMYPNYIRAPHTTRYHRIDIPWSVDLEIEDLKKQYQEFTRDGHSSETSRNTGFKQSAAGCVRRANQRFCSAILRDEECDNKIYPHEHLGDHLVWSFW